MQIQKESNRLIGEISGSIGDLGTFLPYVIGAITIGGLGATGVLFGFGLMYIFTGWFYRVPVPVQPMKVIGAAILVHHLTAGEVAASGIMIGAALIIMAVSGLADRLARLTPACITAGIQAGLGISLALLGMGYIASAPVIGVPVVLLMLLLMGSRRLPASIFGIAAGILLAFALLPDIQPPHVQLGFHLPSLVWPQWQDFSRGFTLAFLPQFPLTLTNSILVTSALAQDLYKEGAARVSERNLCLTLGIGNLLTIPLGGFVMCHGSGGLAAHYRFGGRTGLTPGIIGVVLLLLAVLLGPSGIELLQAIPMPVLGALLLYSGLDLVSSSTVLDNTNEWYVYAVVVVLSIAFNPGVGFVAGLPLIYVLKKGWIRI